QMVRFGRAHALHQFMAKRGSDRLDEDPRLVARQIVEMEQALTKTVAAAATRNDQRHRSRGNRSIGVTDKALDNARVTATDASLCSGRDALLVGAAQQPLHQAKAVEQP